MNVITSAEKRYLKENNYFTIIIQDNPMNIQYLNIYKKKSYDTFKGKEWINPSIPITSNGKYIFWLLWQVTSNKHKWILFVHDMSMADDNWKYDIDNSILSEEAKKKLIETIFSDDFSKTYKKYSK